MSNRESERELLKTWISDLAQARKDVATLPALIEALSARLGSPSRALSVEAAPSTAADTVVPSAKQVEASKPTGLSKPRYRGRFSVPYLMDGLIAVEARSADEVVAYVQNHEAYAESPPNRNTVMTRLAERVKRGVYVKTPDGLYDLPSRAGDEATNGTAHKLASETVAADAEAGQEMRFEVGSR